MISPTKTPLADRLFDDWCSTRLDPDLPSHYRYNDQTALLYETFWRAWAKFLAGRKTPVDRASSAEVEAFLRDESQLHLTTQARYRRLLREVYGRAVLNGLLATNPVDGILDEAIGQREAPTSVSMTPPERAAVLDLLERIAGVNARSRRDRLLVALCLGDGLTLAEARLSKLSSVGFASPRIPRTFDVEALNAKRVTQARTLELHPATCAALTDLLEHESPGPTAWLLRPMKFDRGQAMGRIAGFQAVQDFIDNLRTHGVLERDLADRGPAMLRNSALRAWLESDVPLPEVQRRGGFSRLDAMSRLSDELSLDAKERFDARVKLEHGAGLPSSRRFRARSRDAA